MIFIHNFTYGKYRNILDEHGEVQLDRGWSLGRMLCMTGKDDSLGGLDVG